MAGCGGVEEGVGTDVTSAAGAVVAGRSRRDDNSRPPAASPESRQTKRSSVADAGQREDERGPPDASELPGLPRALPLSSVPSLSKVLDAGL